jgi:hypothetical protein
MCGALLRLSSLWLRIYYEAGFYGRASSR